jgi:chromosome segregation ATPase
VAIILNIREAQATAYYWEYLRLLQLDDITKIYQQLQGGVWNFVKLCKETKAAKMGVSQVINLLNIANNQLPSVQHRYEELQKQNNLLDSIVTTKNREIQILGCHIRDRRKELDAVRSEYVGEAALLQGLQQQRAKVEAFVYDYKNNSEEYVEVINSIENKVRNLLSNKRKFLNAAIISLIESMRNDPEKYSALVYHNNYNQNSAER